MPARSFSRLPDWDPRLHRDRVVLFGGSPRTLDLLRLAAIRSDDVLLLMREPTAPVRRFAERFAIELRGDARARDLSTAEAVLVAIGDAEAENAVVRRSRAAGTPLHVADRPLVSDFTLLEFLEQRASTRRTVAPR